MVTFKSILLILIINTLLSSHVNAKDEVETATQDPNTKIILDKININEASLQQLTNIKGLGKVKAQAILEYIDANGKFVSIDELLEVRGVGNKLIEKIRNKITI